MTVTPPLRPHTLSSTVTPSSNSDPVKPSVARKVGSFLFNSGRDIVFGVGDAVWGALTFPDKALKYWSGVDQFLGQNRPWSFQHWGQYLDGTLKGDPLFRIGDTAAHLFYGALNTVTAGIPHQIFNDRLGLNIEYFAPPPKNLREGSQWVIQGVLSALPFRGPVVRAVASRGVKNIPTPSATGPLLEAGKIPVLDLSSKSKIHTLTNRQISFPPNQGPKFGYFMSPSGESSMSGGLRGVEGRGVMVYLDPKIAPLKSSEVMSRVGIIYESSGEPIIRPQGANLDYSPQKFPNGLPSEPFRDPGFDPATDVMMLPGIGDKPETIGDPHSSELKIGDMISHEEEYRMAVGEGGRRILHWLRKKLGISDSTETAAVDRALEENDIVQEIRQEVFKEIDRKIRSLMIRGQPVIGQTLEISLNRSTGAAHSQTLHGGAGRPNPDEWLQLSLTIDGEGILNIPDFEKARLDWMLAQEENSAEGRIVIQSLLNLAGTRLGPVGRLSPRVLPSPRRPQIPRPAAAAPALLAPATLSLPALPGQPPAEDPGEATGPDHTSSTLNIQPPNEGFPTLIPPASPAFQGDPLGLRMVRNLLSDNPKMPLSNQRRLELLDYLGAFAADPATPFPPWILDVVYKGKITGGFTVFLLPDFPQHHRMSSAKPMKIISVDSEGSTLTLQTPPEITPSQTLRFRSEVGVLPFLNRETVLLLPQSGGGIGTREGYQIWLGSLGSRSPAAGAHPYRDRSGGEWAFNPGILLNRLKDKPRNIHEAVQWLGRLAQHPEFRDFNWLRTEILQSEALPEVKAHALADMALNQHYTDFDTIFDEILHLPADPYTKARAVVKLAQNPRFLDFRRAVDILEKLPIEKQVFDMHFGELAAWPNLRVEAQGRAASNPHYPDIQEQKRRILESNAHSSFKLFALARLATHPEYRDFEEFYRIVPDFWVTPEQRAGALGIMASNPSLTNFELHLKKIHATKADSLGTARALRHVLENPSLPEKFYARIMDEIYQLSSEEFVKALVIPHPAQVAYSRKFLLRR